MWLVNAPVAAIFYEVQLRQVVTILNKFVAAALTVAHKIEASLRPKLIWWPTVIVSVHCCLF